MLKPDGSWMKTPECRFCSGPMFQSREVRGETVFHCCGEVDPLRAAEGSIGQHEAVRSAILLDETYYAAHFGRAGIRAIMDAP